ncbi:uncharacterized protein LOC134234781 [Saccostrea cucullata]|uniref:uncharacterized protein LOC134234781 n=1 Tax=Saccostrea cuccullata TaxID=36930 RepID=UPI002ED29FBD
MADIENEYLLGSPLVHIETCQNHELPIDMICEDCDEFICVKCAKTDHKNHEWNTITTASTEKRRGLLKFLKKIKEEDLPVIDQKIEKIPQKITENKELCDSEIKKLQTHYDEILTRMKEISKCHEKTMKDNMVKKNDQLNHVKFKLEKTKKRIISTLEFMEENNSTMSDYSLIDNHRELTKMLSELEFHMTNCEYSVRFTRGEINDDLLNSVVGKAWNVDNIGMTIKNSFQYSDKAIYALEAFSENQCYLNKFKSKDIENVNEQGVKGHKFSINPTDMCVTFTGDVYFTDSSNYFINCLSPSGSVSTVISTDPLVPWGICQSVDSGLLVTLRDKESDIYNLNTSSRRLVRHITMTGDVIHEYEYQENGQTRLFKLPDAVTQNINSDICVVNHTNVFTGELMIMSPSGRIKSVYRGQNLTEKFHPTDVVCDSLCNILVTDPFNSQIHLLSLDGEFLKFLLTDNEVNRTFSLSFYKSILWVGYDNGLVKVFQYRWQNE